MADLRAGRGSRAGRSRIGLLRWSGGGVPVPGSVRRGAGTAPPASRRAVRRRAPAGAGWNGSVERISSETRSEPTSQAGETGMPELVGEAGGSRRRVRPARRPAGTRSRCGGGLITFGRPARGARSSATRISPRWAEYSRVAAGASVRSSRRISGTVAGRRDSGDLFLGRVGPVLRPGSPRHCRRCRAAPEPGRGCRSG